jgi:adenylate cyclase
MSTNLEIERKFVVNSTHPEWIRIRDSQRWKRLTQATIHKEDGYKLRIRMIEDLDTGERSSFFCFKVSKNREKHDPAIRDEYEWAMPDRNALYMMIGHGEISKVRRSWTDVSGLTWEIDEYEWANAWVITVDVELDDISHTFAKPDWCGWEVTADERLKNSTMQNPDNAYAVWTDEGKDWYKTLENWDGVSIYPTHESKHPHTKPKWYKRAKMAWKVLVGKEV